jgi:hypothetical protein
MSVITRWIVLQKLGQMKILIEMPIASYQGFLGRCLLTSREYAILKNAIINHVPTDAREGNLVEIFCDVEDGKLLLDLAIRVFPLAVGDIEKALSSPSDPGSGISPEQKSRITGYRKNLSGATWHFCANCSQWPTDDFVSTNVLPGGHPICNECIVRNQSGECQ